MANQNSTYINSLVSFLQDTKPYHSKLTEIIEEYQFGDSMNVSIAELQNTSTESKAAWLYGYFSGGLSVPAPTTPVKKLFSPLFHKNYTNNENASNGAFKVGRDENGDALVPFAYDPRAMAGPGFVDVFVERGGDPNFVEPLLEGLDVFQSRGAYVMQIKQVLNSQKIVVGRFSQAYTSADGPFPFTVALPFTNADQLTITGPAIQVTLYSISVLGIGVVEVVGLSNTPNYAPEFVERPNENLIATATAVTQAQALLTTNPTSAVRRISALMDEIAALLVITPDAAASAALAAIRTTLAVPLLPASYEALLNALVAANTPLPTGFDGWIGTNTVPPYALRFVNQTLDEYSPSLYFNHFTDLGIREDGALGYDDIIRADLTITGIVTNKTRPTYEEFTVTIQDTIGTFVVSGSDSGVLGFGAIGSPFVAAQISFNSAVIAGPLVLGDILLTPRAKITIHENAVTQAWSLIKTNPLAYSRPVIKTAAYGYIMDGAGVRDQVTILDTAFPDGAITIVAVNNTTFTLKSSAEPLYTPTITVNAPFNDGRLAFTIVNGASYEFGSGDRFVLQITNPPPMAADLDLYYGYDMDSFDAYKLSSNNLDSTLPDWHQKLMYSFDSRFVNYDFSGFNLQIADTAVNGRSWRLRAIANGSYPLQLQNSTPTNVVNQKATDDLFNANPVSPQFDMPNVVTSDGPQSATDPDTANDLRLWYATSFRLEYYDPGTLSWIVADASVPTSTAYSNSTHGLSFKIVPAVLPFLAAKLHSSWFPATTGGYLEEDVDGGDVISWTVQNPPPAEVAPAQLVSARVARLIMHGNSFYNATPASWHGTFTSPTTYTLQGFYADSALNGHSITAPIIIDTTVSGLSYRDRDTNIHFTLVPGSAGFLTGDTFVFQTYAEQPSYLVYGSVSGWQPEATIGKWYWNGQIGFKISTPEVKLYDSASVEINGPSPWSTSAGVITLNSIRPDAARSTYTVKSTKTGQWQLLSNGKVVGTGSTTVTDDFLSLTMPAAVSGTSFTIKVRADYHDLALGNDLAIIRTDDAKMPVAGDFVLFERSGEDSLQLAIQAQNPDHATTLAPLDRQNIDPRFIDITARSGVSLAATSPETAVLTGWVPVLLDKYDVDLSPAEFSDTATHVVVLAAATGEPIGTVSSFGALEAGRSIFTWNSDFHAEYLPLNTDASIVTLGAGGMNELVSIRMTDGIWFLLDGGGLNEDSLFTDHFSVGVVESPVFKISSSYAELIAPTIADGPFGGFLPGYDNTRYDYETGVGNVNDQVGGGGAFDTGAALTDSFMQAKALRALGMLTTDQQLQLTGLLGQIGNYLNLGNLDSTNLAYFLSAVNSDTARGPSTTGFGFPLLGMGMAIDEEPVSTASTSFSEIMVMLVTDIGDGQDTTTIDYGGFDSSADTIAVFNIHGVPPLTPGLPAPGTLWADYDTELVLPGPARVIQLSFSSNITTIPTVYVWYETATAPVIVPIVERLTPRLFRFALGTPGIVKLTVT